MVKYLSYFPKPVLEDLINGRWLPVIGAGMSLNAKVTSGKRLPLWSELGKKLEEDLNDFVASNPIDTISAFEHEYGRARLVEKLSDILLLRESQPGDAHRTFCDLPFDIVCTTNFDFLLEKQYELTPRYVYPVVEEDQLSVHKSSVGTLLLKLHGDLHHPSRMILTEADYDGFLNSYPLMATYLSNQLITKSAVLIGYSLDDADFRQIWHIVSQRLGRTRRFAYAIVVGANQSEVARFERRGVHVINLPGSREKYGEVLSETFLELKEYIRNNIFNVSTVTTEEPLQQILLPRDAETRLCFFSLPLNLLPFYKSYVFPAVINAGFFPVIGTEVISPGDSITAKIDAILDRSYVMIVEPSTSNTASELQIAIAQERDKNRNNGKKKRLNILIVTEENVQIPALAAQFDHITRTKDWSNNPDDFVNGLITKLNEYNYFHDEKHNNEADRLLDLREYRAATIAAMTSLESYLRKGVMRENRIDEKYTTNFRGLINASINLNYLEENDYDNIIRWSKIRNDAVHTNEKVSLKDAREIVQGVNRIIRR